MDQRHSVPTKTAHGMLCGSSHRSITGQQKTKHSGERKSVQLTETPARLRPAVTLGPGFGAIAMTLAH